jgi:hypothetical protein
MIALKLRNKKRFKSKKMERKLKINITRNKNNPLLPNDFKAHVAIDGNLELLDIVDKMIENGLDMDKNKLVDILSRYNNTIVDLTLSGYALNTGFLNLRPVVRGPFYGKKFHVDVMFFHGLDLREAIAETKVEILSEEEGFDDYNTDDSSNYSKKNEPACGMAFRKWLFSS